jgi:beta-glucanase (GH16 family)
MLLSQQNVWRKRNMDQQAATNRQNKLERVARIVLGITLAALIVVLAALTVHRLELSAAPPPYQQAGEWEIMFRDEFNGTELDRNKWVTCYWWDEDGCTNLGNNELQWYQPENVLVEDGNLILRALEQPIIGYQGQEFPYTSGMVTTASLDHDHPEHASFTFQYGFAEIRAKVPAGQGLWPAFWTLPIDYTSKPEIDILEILGHEPDAIHFAVHYLDEDGESDNEGEWWRGGPDFSQDWHIYAVDWQEDRIIWYVDGIERWRFTDMDHMPATPLYLLLNLAVGGDWPGSPDETTEFPADFLIDYVRVWSRSQ